MKRHLLVTNDFPPKVGGIQNYLWELWRRLPKDSFVVYTTPHKGAEDFDAAQDFKIIRSKEPWLLPYPWLPRRINKMCEELEMDSVIFDPAWPLGFIAPRMDYPYGVVLHGAEVKIPGALPISRQMLKRTLDSCSLAISAGEYPLHEAENCLRHDLPAVVIPPGVDGNRFTPASADERIKLREDFGVSSDQILVSAVSRLVPRKGFSNLINTVKILSHEFDIQLLIAGSGRRKRRLESLIESSGAPAKLLGKVSDEDVRNLYAASDVMAMVCNDRWFGLEQEGFGIVFLEAAACGVPQVAGRSGGSHEAVEHGSTGLVVDDPRSVAEIVGALRQFCISNEKRSTMGLKAVDRAANFDYDILSKRLAAALNNWR